jgi:hypothetical protein
MAAAEPWPGYTRDNDQQRRERLDFKVDEARLRWDLLYAHSLAAAVATYEALDRGAGAEPNAVEKAALEHIEDIAKIAAWGFEEAGGWGHK